MRGAFTALAALLLAGCAGAGAPRLPRPEAARPLALAAPYLDSMIAAGAAPGAVLAVSYAGRHFYHAAGVLGDADATRPDSTTIYDLASLTKVVALTTALAMAVDEGRVSLDAAAAAYVPSFRGGGREHITVRELMTHASGLPAWAPLHLAATDRAGALAIIDTTTLRSRPGAAYEYSDLGAILLTRVVETVYGERLDALLARRLFGPLGLADTRFLPTWDWWGRTAPTERDAWRGRVLRGEVHDENASRLDGVSGHAGLFSSSRDLLAFGDWMLQAWHGTPGDAAWRWPPPPEALRQFTRRQDSPSGSSRALGWDTPSQGSSAGRRLSRSAFGHTGFTGTSIWVDPERRLVVVLLSNRVHPTRENSRWGPVRRNVADRVVAALEGPS